MRTLSLLLLLLGSGFASAAEPAVSSLSVYPTSLKIHGADDAPQLIVTGELTNGRQKDLSADAVYAVTDPKIVRVASSGRVFPLSSGTTTIRVTAAGKMFQVPVTTSDVEVNLPINFPNQVVPVFTKLGCNAGGCHGKASGQNGFKLSLLGFEPDVDYAALVKEARGRRLFPANPEQSLFLRKATGSMAHGGGRKMDPNSEEFKIVRRWIASGTPWGKDSDAMVTRISIYPEQRNLDRQSRQQVAVYAHYSDGSVEDVTRRAQFDSNDPEIATVDLTGVVTTLGMTGESAIMARFLGHVNVFRATVPRTGETPAYSFTPKNFIDNLVQKKWQQLNITPSEVCTDEQFLRRVSLDITGTLPTPKQVLAFLADKDSKKREKLVDALLETPEYSYFFANKWADILRVKRGNNGAQRAFGTFAFHQWIREAIATDKPYDDFVREIVASVGDESKSPPTVWYKDLLTADQFVDNLSQVFLGVRMNCANCHHHPFEKWSQDDYWGLAAYFGRVDRRTIVIPGVVNQNNQNSRSAVFVKATGNVVNKRTNKVAGTKPLDGAEVVVSADADPREKLVDWMADAKNPFFTKAVANRYWAHFFGRGIVDALDDMRVTNPPSNPELLDALAKNLADSKFSLKSLIRNICTSQVYQLSSVPNEFNKNDRQAYARYYPKRMSAEVLFDAVCQVTDSPANFNGLPRDRFAPVRAIMLPDESFASYFLDVFGRPQRISACECERVSEANLAQTLHLLNSDEVQGKLARPGARAEVLAKDPRPDTEKVEEVFLWALGKKPSETQMKKSLENLESHKIKKDAWENILWALINSKSFLFNQ